MNEAYESDPGFGKIADALEGNQPFIAGDNEKYTKYHKIYMAPECLEAVIKALRFCEASERTLLGTSETECS